MPEGIDIPKLLTAFVRGGDPVKVMSSFHYDTLLIGAMHFMDPYNLDLERVQSCGIHITPRPMAGSYLSAPTTRSTARQWKRSSPQAISDGIHSTSPDRPAVTGMQ